MSTIMFHVIFHGRGRKDLRQTGPSPLGFFILVYISTIDCCVQWADIVERLGPGVVYVT